MSRYLCIIIILCLANVTSAGGPYSVEEMAPAEREAAEAFIRALNEDPRFLLDVPERKKQEWISIVRIRSTDSTSDRTWWSGSTATIPKFLFFLGDEETRKAEIAKFESASEDSDLFVKCADPRLIEALAPFLFRDEEFTVTWGATAASGPFEDFVPLSPPSFNAASTIHAILCVSPVFSADVINWARQLKEDAQKQEGPSQARLIRPIIRDWWKENARIFRLHNYKAVLPGRALPNSEAARPKPQSAFASTPIESSPSPAQNVSAPAERDPAPPSPRIFWVTVTIALIAAFGVFFLLRRHRK